MVAKNGSPLVRLDDFLIGQKPYAFYLPEWQPVWGPTTTTLSGRRVRKVIGFTVPAVQVRSKIGEPKVEYKTLKAKIPSPLDAADFLFWECNVTLPARMGHIPGLPSFEAAVKRYAPKQIRAEVAHDGYDRTLGQQTLQVNEDDVGVYDGFLLSTRRRLPKVPPGWVGWYYRNPKPKNRAHFHDSGNPCPLCDPEEFEREAR